MNDNKGFTLIELIVSIAIASILMMVAYSMLGVGLKSHKVVTKEFTEQSSIRYSIDTINTALRFSTVGFAVTEDDFKPVYNESDVDGLVKPWSYIGLSPDKKAFVHYKWRDDGSENGIYDVDILAKAPEDVIYDISFEKSITFKEDEEGNPTNEIEDNNLLNYTLKGFKGSKETFSVQTELEALNALQIIDWGDSINRAVAFAYRTEETPEISERPIAALAMVIDKSGSMDYGMDPTKNISESNPKRITLLKSTLTGEGGLFSILKETESYISLIPFSNHADNPENFLKVKDSIVKLIDLVNNISVGGGTNTGDGMRRAYYQIVNFNDNPPEEVNSNQNIKNYVVVLVDGVTTFASVESLYTDYYYYAYINKEDPEFYFGTNNINRSYKILDDSFSVSKNVTNIVCPTGAGNALDTLVGEPYVQKIGEMIRNSSVVNIEKSFVIGYSSRPSDLQSVGNIATSLGITVSNEDVADNYKDNDSVFIATDKDSLKTAFESIGGYISKDLWQVSGPKLNQ